MTQFHCTPVCPSVKLKYLGGGEITPLKSSVCVIRSRSITSYVYHSLIATNYPQTQWIEMTLIVLNSIGQLGGSLGLSWAHSSIDRQLQVGVSQLSAGGAWPQPGQLGHPGSARFYLRPRRLAWSYSQGDYRGGREEVEVGKGF